MLRALPLAGLLACGGPAGPPEDPADCPDAACREAWAVGRYEADPRRVAELVRDLPDPVERVALVSRLVEAFPGETAALCGALEAGPARKRCEELNQRPHLRAPLPEPGRPLDARATPAGAKVPAENADAGDAADDSTPRLVDVDGRAWPPPFPDLAPREVSCADSRNACQSLAAREAATRADAEGAAAACLAVPDEKWRYECFFQSAEQLLRSRKAGHLRLSRMDAVVALCRGAGPYLGRCLTHVQSEVAGLAPPANREAPADWARVRRAVEALAGALAPVDADLAADLADQTWAQALRLSYATAERVVGTPLRWLPEAAVPHVRAAAAWALVGRSHERDPDLAAWVGRVAEALADRSSTPGERHPGRVRAPRDLWRAPRPEELDAELVRTVHYLGEARRLRAPEEAEDLALCVLEGAALADPPRRELLAAARDDPRPRVAWTARRLAERLREAGSR